MITCYSKDAQCDWIKCLRSKSHVNKNANSEKIYKQLFLETKDSGHVKCRFRIIGRLISIKVL